MQTRRRVLWAFVWASLFLLASRFVLHQTWVWAGFAGAVALLTWTSEPLRRWGAGRPRVAAAYARVRLVADGGSAAPMWAWAVRMVVVGLGLAALTAAFGFLGGVSVAGSVVLFLICWALVVGSSWRSRHTGP